GFIAVRARAANGDNTALGVDVTWHDAEHGAAWRNRASAVRTRQAHAVFFLVTPHVALHANHVLSRDTVGDAGAVFDAGISRFHDGVRGEWGWHEHDRRFGAGFLDSSLDGIENGTTEVGGTAFAGSDAAHDVGAVVDHFLGVERANPTRETLDEDRRIFVD